MAILICQFAFARSIVHLCTLVATSQESTIGDGFDDFGDGFDDFGDGFDDFGEGVADFGDGFLGDEGLSVSIQKCLL